MLRLEDATGFEIPGNIEGANLANLHWLTDNPDGLLWVPPGLDWHPVKFEFHSLREGILTFAALAKFRGSAWARRSGRRYLESISNGLAPDFSWDVRKFDYARRFEGAGNQHPGHTPANENRFQKTVSHGRCIEALVWYYRWTGDDLALELAERLARFHLEYAVAADGRIPRCLIAAGQRPGGPPVLPVHPVRAVAVRLGDAPVAVRRRRGPNLGGRSAGDRQRVRVGRPRPRSPALPRP